MVVSKPYIPVRSILIIKMREVRLRDPEEVLPKDTQLNSTEQGFELVDLNLIHFIMLSLGIIQ